MTLLWVLVHPFIFYVAFSLTCLNCVQELAGNITEMAKKLGEMWRECEPSQREVYIVIFFTWIPPLQPCSILS